jgi:hypothetical protein
VISACGATIAGDGRRGELKHAESKPFSALNVTGMPHHTKIVWPFFVRSKELMMGIRRYAVS